MRKRGLPVEDPIPAAVETFPQVASESDVVFALTHNGIVDDAQLARVLPDLSGIVGGHSHSRPERPLFVGRVPIVQAGNRGKSIGRVDLFFKLENGRWILTGSSGRLIPLDEKTKADPQVNNLIEMHLAEN